jgi:F-type H+-transporting ATPase subunit b
MDQTLKQVGELLLGAVPTAILLLLLYAIYNNLVRKPLNKVLEERRERTEGAFVKARADIADAEARTQEYEQRLREARLAIFRAQEARRQQAQQSRTEAVQQARTRAQEQVREARASIEQDMAAARAGLQSETERLAGEIIRTILRPAGAAPALGGRPS